MTLEGMNLLEVQMIFEEGFLSLRCFSERHLLSDLLLTPAPDDHVALLQVDDLIMDNVNHCLLCAFVHQIRLGQDT